MITTHGGPFQPCRRQLLRPPATARSSVEAAAAVSSLRRYLRRFSEVSKILNLSSFLFDSLNGIFRKFDPFSYSHVGNKSEKRNFVLEFRFFFSLPEFSFFMATEFEFGKFDPKYDARLIIQFLDISF